MRDEHLRELERRWRAQGDPAADAYDQACRRAGAASPPRTLAYAALVRTVGRWGMRRFLQRMEALQENIYQATVRGGHNYLMVGAPVMEEFVAAHGLDLDDLIAQGHIVPVELPQEDGDALAPLR